MGRRATILLLFFWSLGNSFAQNVVAPTRAEMDAMYAAAVQDVNAGNYGQALQKLDAIDARQPDLAVAKNLRGIALMRMGEYRLAENALQKARELDPTLWEAQFNLAEVPFLQKNWSESRDRFEAMAKEPNEQRNALTNDLIQFKILLTWLRQHKDSEANQLLQRLKSSSASPAYYCGQAALAFQQGDETGARVNLRAAEKAFPTVQTKLFLESFYEMGWLKKPKGYVPVALETDSAADRTAAGEGYLKEAEQAYKDGDYNHALQLLEKVDTVAPNQAVTDNLRGEILLAQGKSDQAEFSFRKALAANPQMEEARFNLAQIPLRKGDYESARRQLEELQGAGANASEPQRLRQQLIQYEIYLTLLLQNHDGTAQKVMEQFKMTDETPALYYAQAAWAFRHRNSGQARNWLANARNLFSQEQNRAFAAPLEVLGWLENTAGSSSTPPALLVQTSPSPIAQTTPKPAQKTAENLPATQPGPTGEPKESAVMKEEPVAVKESASERKRNHRRESRSSNAAGSEDHKRAERSNKKKKPRRRDASREAVPKNSPSPSPTPTPSPEPTRRPALQQFGETVVHVLTSPFRRRSNSEPSPSPSPSATAAPRPAPSSAGRN